MHDEIRFVKFTERARRVFSLAQEEAQRFNHNYIGTEHLLLGLVREGDGVGAKVLAAMGVELDAVRQAVEDLIGRGDRIVLGEIGLTSGAKKVIELSLDEARRLNHYYIGTEHVLLGLVREEEGLAAEALRRLGVNLEKARTRTIQVLSRTSSSQSSRAKEASGFSFPSAASAAPSFAGEAAPTQPYKLRHLNAAQPTRAWISEHGPAAGSLGTLLGRVIIGTGGEFTLTLYNGIEEDAQVISIITRPPSGAVFPFQCLLERGLAYTLEGTPGSATVMYAELAG